MWSKKEMVSVKTKATKEQIWDLWSDVENWNKWDSDVEFSNINGKFEVGTFGILKPIKAPKSKFELVKVEKFTEFTTCSSLPLSKMYFTHELYEKNGELYISHGVEIKGILAFLFFKIIGENIMKNLPQTLEKLSKMAEHKTND